MKVGQRVVDALKFYSEGRGEMGAARGVKESEKDLSRQGSLEISALEVS